MVSNFTRVCDNYVKRIVAVEERVMRRMRRKGGPVTLRKKKKKHHNPSVGRALSIAQLSRVPAVYDDG
jgi:hypothetical protein